MEMNKTITIYELLGLIKDGKELPKLENEVEKDFGYYIYDKMGETCNLEDLKKLLYDEVEIIEDNDKLEIINITEDSSGNTFIETNNHKYTIRAVDKYFANKINKIIDHINKRDEKLDEK